MSALPWFRLYHRMVDDEKLRLLAFEDRWHFVALCCLKAGGLLDEPVSDLRCRKIAVKLGVQVRELEEIGRRLSEVGLVDAELCPLAWEELQQRSDSSTERVKKYREKRRENGLSAGFEAYQKHYPVLMKRDGGACVYCHSTENLCIDHMVPIAQGGTDEIDNLAIACKACNSGKAGRTPEQARYKILTKSAKVALSRYVTVSATPLDREEDTDKEKKEPKGSSASGDAPLTADEVLEGWNELAQVHGLAQVRKLTDARRRKVLAQAKRFTVPDWQAVFAKIAQSPFLKGDNRQGWRCDFDFILSENNFVKILEGKYDRQ